jgi:hypothetical protein
VSTSKAAAGRIGGLIRAATAESPRAITKAARDGRWQKYLDAAAAIAPGAGEADLIRRAQLLRRAEMSRLSQLGVKARRAKAAARIALQITDEH